VGREEYEKQDFGKAGAQRFYLPGKIFVTRNLRVMAISAAFMENYMCVAFARHRFVTLVQQTNHLSMKNTITCTLLLVAFFATAQTPQGLNYQAVYRNAQGNAIANQDVNVQFSILDGAAGGPAVYVENHSTQTSQFGLFNLTIGQGTPVSGSFSTINWGNSEKFLKVEVNNTLLGTTQLLSVPYALYAEKTNIQAGNGIAITGNTITNTGDVSNTNEIQTLGLTGSTLSLNPGGGSVTLPSASQWTTNGSNIYYNLGKVLIGSNTTPIISNPTNLLQVASNTQEAGLHLAGKGGSNHTSILMTELSTGSGWAINHKATANGGINHHLMIDYYDAVANQYTNALKCTNDGKTGLGYQYTETPPSKLSVKGGDVNILDVGSGVIMKSPDGKCWRMTVSNAGLPVFTSITCP